MNGLITRASDEIPSADCSYVAPNTCTGEPGSQPGGCCEGTSSTLPGSGATKLGQFSMLELAIFALMALVLHLL